MFPKASLAGLLLASMVYGADTIKAEAKNGEYAIITPQTTEKQEAAQRICSEMGAGWELADIESLFNTPKELREKSEKSIYASKTENPANPGEIYYFSFENKDVNILKKNDNMFFVCFKPLKTENDQDRFVKKDALINDKKLKLLWLNAESNRADFKEAKGICEAKGARLPHINELFSIAIYKAFNEQKYKELFGRTQPRYHWSGDENDDFSNTALVSGFMRASVASSAKDNKSFVRCVKDAK